MIRYILTTKKLMIHSKENNIWLNLRVEKKLPPEIEPKMLEAFNIISNASEQVRNSLICDLFAT